MTKTIYVIKKNQSKDGWIFGTINGFRFQAKVYDEGSVYGINEGRVSKLMIWDEAKHQETKNIIAASILNYDRGWDKKPKKAADHHILTALVAYLESLPTSEEAPQ